MVGYYDPREEIQIIGVNIDTTGMNEIESLATQITVYEQIERFNNAMRLENRYKEVCRKLEEYESEKGNDKRGTVSISTKE